jgi:predicted heme/steroid binding protein
MSEKEMKDQIDFMVARFQNAIKKFDEFSEKMINVLSFMNDVSLKVSDLSKDHDNLKEKLIEYSDKCENGKTTCLTIAGTHSSWIKELQNDSKDSGKIFRDFKGKVYDLFDQVAKMNEKLQSCASINHILDIKKDIQSNATEIENVFKHSLESMSGILDSHQKLKFFVDSIATDIGNFVIDSNKKNKSIADLQSTMGLIKNSLDASLKEVSVNLKSYIDSKISSIPQPVIPSLDEAKAHADKKVEPALLDSRNANIRSENNEKKIFIMEKKIEQLQLMLNKLQLG